jgi:hypothetical protein
MDIARNLLLNLRKSYNVVAGQQLGCLNIGK